jgi:hypothetical protein
VALNDISNSEKDSGSFISNQVSPLDDASLPLTSETSHQLSISEQVSPLDDVNSPSNFEIESMSHETNFRSTVGQSRFADPQERENSTEHQNSRSTFRDDKNPIQTPISGKIYYKFF